MRRTRSIPHACVLAMVAALGTAGCTEQPAPVAPTPVVTPKVTAKPAMPTAAQTARSRQDAEKACAVEAQQATSEEPDELVAAEAQRHLHEVCMAQRGF